MLSDKRWSAPAQMRRLCTLGLPMEAIVPALMRTLYREALCGAGLVLWFDSRGEVVNLYAPRLPAPAALGAWFGPPPQTRSSASKTGILAGPDRRNAYMATCTDGDDDGRDRDDDRAAPLCPSRHLCGAAAPATLPLQRLCSTVTRHGSPMASLMVYRPAALPPFGRKERVAVKAAGRYLSLNDRSIPADTSAAMYRAGGEHGFLECEPDGRVIRASANGYELLAQASGCPVNRATVPDRLEQAGRQLIQHLLAEGVPRGEPLAPAAERMTTLINPWGLFRLRAFFDGSGPLGVLIERVEHLLVRLVEAMELLDLSVQQGETLLLLAQGLSQDRIAERMGVTHNTADYHIRQLYSKLDAHTRNEAIASALGSLESAPA